MGVCGDHLGLSSRGSCWLLLLLLLLRKSLNNWRDQCIWVETRNYNDYYLSWYLVLDWEVQLELSWKLIFRVKSIRKINSPNATICMDLSGKKPYQHNYMSDSNCALYRPEREESLCSLCHKLCEWSLTGWTESGSNRHPNAWAWCIWRASHVWWIGNWRLEISVSPPCHLKPKVE